MSADQSNKEVIQKLYSESLNKHNMELLRNFVSDDFVGSNGEEGPDAFAKQIQVVLNALPDAEWKIQELIAEGDKVVVRWKLEGTHTGPFHTIAATGNKVSNDGIGFFRLSNGKIIEDQVFTDRLGFLQELEVVSSDLLSPNGNTTKEQVQYIGIYHGSEDVREEFIQNINRKTIQNLPGFIEDAVYECTDDEGNIVFVTIAAWESEKALEEAKETVQAGYKQQGINPAEMLERLNITAERGMFKEVL